MAAINPNDLAKLSWIFELYTGGTWHRLASVRGLTTTIDDTNVVEIKADDTGTVLKVVDRTANVAFELLENRGRDTLGLLFGGTSTNVAGTPVAVTGENAWTTISAGVIYTLAKANGAGTEVASITVSDTGWALVLSTDYLVWVDTSWKTYIVFINATTWATTVDYTYTPNASENLTLDLTTIELKNFAIRVTAEDVNGKKSYTTLTSATLNSEYSISYADVIEAGDITGATLTFTANKGSQFVYENEII
jgi:hypothetical protein